MAENMTMADAGKRTVTVSHPASPVSGDPVRYGATTGVCTVTEDGGGNATGKSSVDFSYSQWLVPVKGVDAGGNSPVAPGDKIFYVDADTPPLSKKVAGTYFGIADEAVTTGQTATIRVTHVPS